MKTILLILACAAIAGCEYQPAADGTTLGAVLDVSIKVRTVRGHDYIVVANGVRGVSVVHAESCPCRLPRIYGIEDLVTTNRLLKIGDCVIDGMGVEVAP